MKRFYPDFQTLNHFTLSLDYHRHLIACPHCSKQGQLISHGIIYKQRSIKIREAVGKRIICSKRYGRHGCGRTTQLYIAQQIPTLRYAAIVLFTFIKALFHQRSVHHAYQTATGQTHTRHAWRWITKLQQQLIHYRRHLHRPIRTPTHLTTTRVRRLQHILTTLYQLCPKPLQGLCSNYQLQQQHPFI